jgi:CxxC motif-containing protein
MEAARALDPVVVDRPVECGEVVVKDILGLGVDIIATDRLERN